MTVLGVALLVKEVPPEHKEDFLYPLHCRTKRGEMMQKSRALGPPYYGPLDLGHTVRTGGKKNV